MNGDSAKPLPIWLGFLGYAVFLVLLGFGAIAVFTSEWNVAFCDLGIVACVVATHLERKK